MDQTIYIVRNATIKLVTLILQYSYGTSKPVLPPIVGLVSAYRRAECYLTPHLLSSFRTEDRSISVTSLKFGASSRTRTGTPQGHKILSLGRLPIPPYSHKTFFNNDEKE